LKNATPDDYVRAGEAMSGLFILRPVTRADFHPEDWARLEANSISNYRTRRILLGKQKALFFGNVRIAYHEAKYSLWPDQLEELIIETAAHAYVAGLRAGRAENAAALSGTLAGLNPHFYRPAARPAPRAWL